VPTTEPAPAGEVAAPRIAVEVVHAWPDRCWSRHLVLPEGTCVGDALDAVAGGLAAEGLVLHDLGLAVFGRAVGRETPLRDGDRVELLRPLLMDPRQARAARAAAARKRAAAPRRGLPG
jgi:putative ubiquitin-RnfH superfamily antitoxin RatB of RatAB toxin-antitoxin module